MTSQPTGPAEPASSPSSASAATSAASASSAASGSSAPSASSASSAFATHDPQAPAASSAPPMQAVPVQLSMPGHMDTVLRAIGLPNSARRQFDFLDDSYEWRRVFSELFGTFLLVLVAAGGGMVNARFGGDVSSRTALVVAPALMVAAIILFMGAVSGAHLNPAVSLAFALRRNFPWKRVPAYVAAQAAGAVLATLLLWALVGKHGSAGLTLPGPGISTVTAMIWEAVLTMGLVSVILGVSSGAQQVGSFAAIGVGSYIALAGLWASPVSGASMNPARSLGPALVLGDWTSWWAYLVGPVAGAAVAVGIAYILRGPGGGTHGVQAAQGTLGVLWTPERIGTAHPVPVSTDDPGGR
jgi:aquaporin Z